MIVNCLLQVLVCVSVPVLAQSMTETYMTTFDGVNYTFNDCGGEYLLFNITDRNDPRNSIEFQVRSERIPLDANRTHITAVAVRDRLTNTDIQLEKLDSNGTRFTVNGTETDMQHAINHRNLSVTDSGEYLAVSHNHFRVFTRIYLGQFLSVSSNIICQNMCPNETDIVGLLGNNNLNTTDDLKLRNGTLIPLNASDYVMQDFVQSWKIQTPLDSLFMYNNRSDHDFQYYNNEPCPTTPTPTRQSYPVTTRDDSGSTDAPVLPTVAATIQAKSAGTLTRPNLAFKLHAVFVGLAYLYVTAFLRI